MRKLPRRVYVKHSTYWFVDLTRRWHKLSRVNDGEAKMYLALAARIDAPPLSRMPGAVGAFKAEYLPGLAMTTQKEHERLLDIAAEEFSNFDVADVRPTDVARSVKNLYTGRPTAARHYKARLSTFFRWAVQAGLRGDNPCREIWLKAPPKRDRYITDDEFGKIRAWLLRGDDGQPTGAGEMARVFVELCYLTAQRPTDVRRLQWSQVRIEAIAFKPSKTEGSSGAKVLVHRTPAINAILERARTFVRPATKEEKRSGKHRAAMKSMFVVHALDGGPYTMSGIRSAWQRACRRAAVKNATIKDLRAKALTDARRLGYGLEQLQIAAAHRSITTTEGYLRVFDEPRSSIELTLPDMQKLDTGEYS